MSCKEILEKAIRLKPHEKLALIESLLRSLDEPDKGIDEIWAILKLRKGWLLIEKVN